MVQKHMCVSNFYHWEIDIQINFRRLVLHNNKVFAKEIDNFIEWNGEYYNCCKCKKSLPKSQYFFISGGKGKFHRYCKLCEGSPSYGWGRNYNNELNKNNKHYCTKCDRVLPLNPIYFTRTNGKCNKTGYSSNCKECTDNEFGIKSFNDISLITDRKEDFKICHSCKIELPNNDDYFFKKSDREHGQTKCKKCLGFEYGIQKPNIVLKDTLEEDFVYCTVCKEVKHISETTGDKVCKECKSERLKFYYINNPNYKTRLRINSQKRRHKIKNLDFTLTQQEYNETLEYFDNSCAYCGLTEEENKEIYNKTLHQDHVIPLVNNGGYTKGNIIPACNQCNCSKNAKSLDDFLNYSEKFTYDRYEKIKAFIDLHNTINTEL